MLGLNVERDLGPSKKHDQEGYLGFRVTGFCFFFMSQLHLAHLPKSLLLLQPVRRGSGSKQPLDLLRIRHPRSQLIYSG